MVIAEAGTPVYYIAAPWNLISKKILIPGLEKITKTLE